MRTAATGPAVTNNAQVFSGERTIYSDEFEEFESEVEPIRKGIER